MPNALRPVVGLVTIGQSPRPDIVPDMAAIIGPGVDIREAGALDGLTRAEVDALKPTGDDEILVTRLTDGTGVFVGKQKIVRLVEERIARLERDGAQLTALLCTGAFPPLRATRSLILPQPVLFGTLRGMSWPGRLGIVTPSVPHVPQTEARWRGHGWDPVVVPLSPYEHGPDPGAADRFRREGVGLVLLDCMGFRRSARRELQDAFGVPLIVANLLVARVVGEMVGE